ncbi:MAG: DNA methyltransferase, partial [Kiritimatiellae bacterium]|nr:DNA methyltransferase [Kiritimatiellia bacterium]
RDMDITLIKPYERNPRNNDKAIDAVAKSIQEFGWNSPIVVDRDNVIVCGHSRWRAAQKLGLTTVPVYVADKLTPEQVQAYRIADNKTAELADWNYDLLPLELRALQDAQYDLTLLGFDTGELEKLLSGEDNVSEGETDPDAIPAVPEVAASCLGEIYQLGNHRLLCGSSTDENDVARLMEGTKAKMLFTSPPYSDMRDYNGGKDLSVENLVSFIGCYLPYTDYQCVNLGLQRRDAEVVEYWNSYIEAARQAGYKMLAWNVWDKGVVGSIGLQKAMFPIRHEWVFVFGTEPFAINRTWEKKECNINAKKIRNKVRQKDGTTRFSTVGDTSNPLKAMESVLPVMVELGSIRHEHPATFPVGLPLEYIRAMSQPSDTVIEPFAGSGSTVIACEQVNRICRAMELDPKYCDVIRRRWAEFVHGEGCDWKSLTPAIEEGTTNEGVNANE